MSEILLSPHDLHDAVSAVLSDISTIRYAVSDEQWAEVADEIVDFVKDFPVYEYEEAEEASDLVENEPESKPDTRAERRKATAHKVNQREALMHSLGKKAGSLHNKQRQKIDRSLGYMRSGNVSHYAETKPTQKTNNRKGYGKSRNLSRRDVRYMAMTDFEEE